MKIGLKGGIQPYRCYSLQLYVSLASFIASLCFVRQQSFYMVSKVSHKKYVIYYALKYLFFFTRAIVPTLYWAIAHPAHRRARFTNENRIVSVARSFKQGTGFILRTVFALLILVKNVIVGRLRVVGSCHCCFYNKHKI